MDNEDIYQKCGEIYFAKTKIYSFLCYYCNEIFQKFDEFKAHTLVHLNLNESFEAVNVNIDPINSKVDEPSDVNAIGTEELVYKNENDKNCGNEKKILSKSIHNFKNCESKSDNFENLVDESCQNKLSEETQCPYCKILFKYDLHDIEKCLKTQETVNKYKGDFIKLLQEGILCCWYCRSYFEDYRKLYEHHIKEKHCFHKDKCKICKFYTFMNLKINSRQNLNILNKDGIIQQNSEDDFDSLENNQNEYHCQYCDEKFKEKLQLEKHELLSHEKDEFQFKCSLCGRVFRKKYQMQLHMRIHNNERPYKCDICSAAFTVSANLRNHIVYKHTDDRPFVCAYEGCDAKFKLFNLKRQHEKTHLPANFQCEMCGNYFKTKSILLKHQQNIHVGIKNRPHQCEICHKRFAQPGHLGEHKRIHTGEKPFGCDICSKFFRKRNALKEHKKLHSDERKYICRFCGKGFKQAAGYWGHMKRHPIIS